MVSYILLILLKIHSVNYFLSRSNLQSSNRKHHKYLLELINYHCINDPINQKGTYNKYSGLHSS